ncbi:hypothetical protein OUZ56_021548 [Daphnia magna]|uniref:Uncharacterized protein n=1 Tax=Daphnia magna TaxID=35525 RepID=A0ABQ9ZHR5_9CRUS|nr:hypothetical protein OUZ56_021548 [Daphnia magna]
MEKDKYPVKVYSEKLVEALVNDVIDERQKVDVVRDLRLGDDEIYHLIELKQETDFIHDIVLSPYQIVTCFSKETLGNFQKLIDRDNLPSICLSYDTAFEMGDFYVSI